MPVDLLRRDYFNSGFTSNLTITSIGFNPVPRPSPWVSNLFMDTKLSSNTSSIPPSCSIEMLGTLFLKKRSRYTPEVITGEANLRLKYNHRELIYTHCYHRALFLQIRSKFHYAMPFYCPISTQAICSELSRSVVQAKTSVFVQVRQGDNIDFAFHAIIPLIEPAQRESALFNPSWKPVSYIEKPGSSVGLGSAAAPELIQAAFNSTRPPLRLGICAVLPYASQDADAISISKRKTLDFIQYYSHLGFTVFLYDRLGQHFSSAFAAFSHLHYYNYTLGQYLFPSEAPSLFYSDEDKTMTYNHCRFEARVSHNIDAVVIADIDEFLYCQELSNNTSAASASAQRLALQQVFQYYAYSPLHQLLFLQLHPSPAARDFKGFSDCFLHAARRNHSLLQCYQPLEQGFSFKLRYKATYLGLDCPVTGLHHSCMPENGIEGICSTCGLFRTTIAATTCHFIHVSLKKRYSKYLMLQYNQGDTASVPPFELINVLESS